MTIPKAIPATSRVVNPPDPAVPPAVPLLLLEFEDEFNISVVIACTVLDVGVYTTA